MKPLRMLTFQVCIFYSLSTNPTKYSNTLKQFVGNLQTICLSAFDHFVAFAVKGLRHKNIRYLGLADFYSLRLLTTKAKIECPYCSVLRCLGKC